MRGRPPCALATLLATGSARAERRPPFGNDAQLLEANVREQVQRRIAPLLEQMAPGQAELKYVDVRVNRPTALPAGRRARVRGADARDGVRGRAGGGGG